MYKRDDTVYLQDMLESISAVKSFVESLNIDSFQLDRKTYSATLRELEIIGEAGGRISDSLKMSHPEID